MGFLKPELPVIDMPEWLKGSRSERIRPMAVHWAETGFGTPIVLHLFYVVKIVLYILACWLFALTTEGIDGFTNIGSWWSEPIVFEKAVLFTVLFEVVGLGCSFGPLANRFNPPMGSILYWLRPGTMRLPPWPGRIPLTAGTTRSPVDAALYAALLVMTVWALLSDGTGPIAALDTTVGVLPIWQIATILGLLAVLGLRDKVIFLGARGEVYAPLLVAFMFTGADVIVAAKLVFMVIWIGAATSKLNKHFPFVMSTMMSNNPIIRPKGIKRRFFENFPEDLRPGRLARLFAHVSTAVEMGVPLVLFFSNGGWLTAVAAVVMVCFHLGIVTAIPMGVPLEWNIFMIFGVFILFVAHPGLGLSDVNNPIAVIVLFLTVAGFVVLGNLSPRRVSFLPGMRYYAGNWDTSMWCMKPSAEEKIGRHVAKIQQVPMVQMAKTYGVGSEDVPLYMAYAFRAMNSHGRALFTLAQRAIPAGHEEEYVITEGEVIAGTVLGWNFGDGHMHNEQLIAALQERCHFEPDEVRVIILEAQPIQRQTQQYRLVDAAAGEFERGEVKVADMVTRQPWQHDVPVHVHDTARTKAK